MNEAEMLFSDVLGCDRAALYLEGRRKLPAAARERIAAALRRRMQGEPLQYILGREYFFGLEFRVTGDVLIPRPETELLVEQALSAMRESLAEGAAPTVLDIGTGSGCVAIAIASAQAKARVTAVDVSEAAILVAQENASRHKVSGRVAFLRRDILAEGIEGQFDIIVSNPPYVREGDIDSLQQEVRREPRLALSGGEDGLAFYRAIAVQGEKALRPQGRIFLELGAGQEEAVRQILLTHNFRDISVQNDYNGIARVLSAKSGRTNG